MNAERLETPGESIREHLDFFTTTRNGYRAPRKSMRSTYTVGYDVLRAARMEITIHWDVTPPVIVCYFKMLVASKDMMKYELERIWKEAVVT
jgi:hypothetical protein